MQPLKSILKILQNKKKISLINTEKAYLIYICTVCNYIFTSSTRQGIYLKTVAFGGILLTALIAFLILNMKI